MGARAPCCPRPVFRPVGTSDIHYPDLVIFAVFASRCFECPEVNVDSLTEVCTAAEQRCSLSSLSLIAPDDAGRSSSVSSGFETYSGFPTCPQIALSCGWLVRTWVQPGVRVLSLCLEQHTLPVFLVFTLASCEGGARWPLGLSDCFLGTLFPLSPWASHLLQTAGFT